MKKKSTAYDDVYRTMMNDCITLLIPLVNEVFGKNYTGSEKIVFHPNEHFINQQDGKEQKRITDSSFSIISDDGSEENTLLNANRKMTILCSSEFLSTLLRKLSIRVLSPITSSSLLSQTPLCFSFARTAILLIL